MSINRYGFNSEGHENVYQRLCELKNDPSFKGILGVNLGKNKDAADPVDDYIKGIQKFGGIADYLVINISRYSKIVHSDYNKSNHQLKCLTR